MHQTHEAEHHPLGLKDKVRQATDEAVEMCYQCGKCTAGCPLASEFDYSPNQILRMLQLGLPEFEEKILSSYAIWLCLSCQTCVTRCPKEVDFPAIMDWLRQESLRRGLVHPKAKDIVAFHKTFLGMVKQFGRLYEVGLIAGYKMKTFHLMQDVKVAPTMFFNGLLKILPHNVKNKQAISRIFEKTIESEDTHK
jgi:heterodisulfide reductase subunit C